MYIFAIILFGVDGNAVMYISMFSSACNFYSIVVCFWFSHVFSSSKLSIGWATFAFIFVAVFKSWSHWCFNSQDSAKSFNKETLQWYNDERDNKFNLQQFTCGTIKRARVHVTHCYQIYWITKKLANLSATFLPLSLSPVICECYVKWTITEGSKHWTTTAGLNYSMHQLSDM